MSRPSPARPPVYTNYFEFFRVDGYDLLDAAFQIRYQVYCEERGFLDPHQYPTHVETDAYDRTSVHFVGRHRLRYMAAGTARLVLPSRQGFPLQRHCEFDRQYAFLGDAGHPALRQYAEISRLAVSKFFRQRADDTVYGGPARPGGGPAPAPPPAPVEFAEPAMNPAEAGPEIVAGLLKSLYHEIKRLGITHVVVAMERSLHLLLRRLGCQFQPVGPVADYYGPVTPYIARISDLERHLYLRRRSVFDYWMEGLEPEYMPTSLLVPPARPRTQPLVCAQLAGGKRR